jgi:histidine ammonia-lyase
VFALEEAKALARAADCIAAMSLDAIRGSLVPFSAEIHELRPHPGQLKVAANIRMLFEGHDAIMASHEDCTKVQDPYSFRCIPQVHGASRDAINYAEHVLERELNSVTDNPLCFTDGTIASGGNFHAQPVALALDFLGLAVAELGSIAERRVEKLTNPAMSGLPAFLATNGGLESGFMIPHVVAAALVSENKILCHPASSDSIPTSADKEDHVSMGPIAARKAREIARNVSYVLAIELIAAVRGLDLLAPLSPAPALAAAQAALRKHSKKIEGDRSMHHDIEGVAAWILSGGLIAALREHGIIID